MFRHRVRIITLAGFEVYVDLSWVIIAALVTWSLGAGTFPYYYPELSTSAHWIMAVVGAVALFASIVIHEFSHSIVARHFGLSMKSITLFLFGGVAEMEEHPRSAGVEFAMAIAGPLASIVLGLGLLLLRGVTPGWPLAVTGVISYLGIINLALAGFNLLPAFPLDGGRVLRSLLWSWRKDLRVATRISTAIGSGFGWLFFGIGIFSVLRGNLIGGIWMAFIGLFLRTLSRRSYTALLIKQALEREDLRRFVEPGSSVPASLPVREFINRHVYRVRARLFPVVSDDRLVGCISTEELRRTPQETWGEKQVGDIARSCTVREKIPMGMDASEALEAMRKSGSNRVFVVEGERFIGTVRLEALLHFVAAKIDIGEMGAGAPSIESAPDVLSEVGGATQESEEKDDRKAS